MKRKRFGKGQTMRHRSGLPIGLPSGPEFVFGTYLVRELDLQVRGLSTRLVFWLNL
jgi:hypothetical protein